MSPRKKIKALSPGRLVNLREALLEFAVAQENLASTNIGLPALDETEIVTRVLVFAHGDAAIEEMHDALRYRVGIFSHDIPIEIESSKSELRDLLRDLPGFKKRILQEWDSASKERQWFGYSLATIANRKRAAINKLRAELPVTPPDVFVLSKLDWTYTNLCHTDKIVSLSVKGICIYVIMLLLDPSRDLGDALRRCKLEECSRFFLSFPSASGGPRPSYCKPEHRILAAKLTGPERTARWRKGKAKKRGKKS